MAKLLKKEKTSVISFISGKGGAGKTALSASAGKVLSNIDSSVLLIDSDLVTHGATFLLGFDENKLGILEIYNMIKNQLSDDEINERYYYDENIDDFLISKSYEENIERYINEYLDDNLENIVYNISLNFDYVQSTSMPSREYSRLVYQKGTDLSMVLKFIVQYFIKSGKYEYILIDSQAGAVETTEIMTKLSTKCVIVMEPDPVATYATENIVSEFKDSLPLDSFYLINKLSVDEASTYRSIEQFVKMLRHLNPVPFDFEVRRAFMLRKIPIEESKPTSFMFGIIRMLKDLLPHKTISLDSYQEYLEDKILKPISDKIYEIETQLDDLIQLEYRMKNKLDGMGNSTIDYIYKWSDTFVMFIAALFLTFYFFDVVVRGESIINLGNEAYYLIVGLLMAIILRTYSKYIKDKIVDNDESLQIKLEIEGIRERRNRLRSEYDSYKNLMITRSTEMMLDNE